jgi:hypothetical protein
VLFLNKLGGKMLKTTFIEAGLYDQVAFLAACIILLLTLLVVMMSKRKNNRKEQE